jgi:hypothetical protein
MSCCGRSSVVAKTVRCCSGCGSACPKLALFACLLSARLSHICGFVFLTRLFRVLIFSCCSVWSHFSRGGCSLFVKLAKVHIPMSKLMRSRRLLSSLLLRRCFHGQRASPIHLQQQQKISSAAATRGEIDDAQQQDVRRLWSRATFSRSKFSSGYTALTPKSLDSIMKIDTVRYTSPQEIIAIWNDYHIGRGHISAGMGRDLYKLLQQRANQCPLFVLPLRKGNGFVSILVQGMAFQLGYEQSFCKYLSSVLPGLAVFAHSRIYEVLRVGEGIVTTMANAVKVTIQMRMNRM